jgi:hypothetical protein
VSYGSAGQPSREGWPAEATGGRSPTGALRRRTSVRPSGWASPPPQRRLSRRSDGRKIAHRTVAKADLRSLFGSACRPNLVPRYVRQGGAPRSSPRLDNRSDSCRNEISHNTLFRGVSTYMLLTNSSECDIVFVETPYLGVFQ